MFEVIVKPGPFLLVPQDGLQGGQAPGLQVAVLCGFSLIPWGTRDLDGVTGLPLASCCGPQGPRGHAHLEPPHLRLQDPEFPEQRGPVLGSSPEGHWLGSQGRRGKRGGVWR